MNKLVFLGLDGATWKQLDKFLSEGLMPNLSSIINNGVRGELHSTFPFTSRTSWLTMLTGTNPGKHGIPHHIVGGIPAVPLIWQILSDAKLKSIIVNDIVTYPPSKIDGIMISGGFSTPHDSRDFVYPESLYDEINKIANGYIPSLGSTTIENIQNGFFDNAYAELQEYGDKIIKTSLHLAKKFDWSILSVTLEHTDYFHHFFWNKPVFLQKFYQWLDGILADLYSVSRTNNANLLIVSDHGFGPIEKHFLVNSWLRDSNISNFGKPGKIRKYLSTTKIKRDYVRKSLSRLHMRSLASKITPSELKKIIPIEQYEDGYIQDSSTVYSEAYNEITINVNEKAQYEKLRDRVIKELLQIEDNGRKVVLEAHKREEIFHGPYVDRAYDVQILLNEGYCWSSSIKEKYLLTPTEFSDIRSGDHRPEGILIAVGPDIKKGSMLSSTLKILDISPTILHMLGRPIPSYMEGNVAKEILDESSVLFKKDVSIQKKNEKEFLKNRISERRHLLRL